MKKMGDRREPKRMVLWSAALVATFALGMGFAMYFQIGYPSRLSSALRENSSQYAYINPLLACGINDTKSFREFDGLKTRIQRIITRAQQNQQVRDVSVYYRDLNAGKWMGIGQDALYAPASLYKITLLIAFLKKAEQNPGLLDTRYVFSGTSNPAPTDYAMMTVGKSYTVRELLERLIVYSDNEAKDMLHAHIEQRDVNEVFTDLGLATPALDDRSDSMSAKSYSLFFRTLYNATYLSRDMSELALSMLSKVVFRDGLASAVPENVQIAHKYGYRVFNPPENGISAELHDCGIVYEDDHPYFLCIMTKGWNYDDLAAVIKNISADVYSADR